MVSPLFPAAPQTPGNGLIHAVLLPPRSHTLSQFEFMYPLKLISSATASFITVFILSYGGGLVSNDRINLRVQLDEGVKLCLLTQGSTKVFKLRPGDQLTAQAMTVTLAPHSSLALLPDPVQPFADSVYAQHQKFTLPKDGSASLIFLDWVSEGRSSRGERWQLRRFSSKNEVFEGGHDALPGARRLLLRDSLLLQGGPEEGVGSGESLCARMDGLAVISTLVIRGPKFEKLAAHVLAKFEAESRIGSGGQGWNWDKNRQDKHEPEFKDIIWTAASVRGFVLVKVSARALEEARNFILDLLLQGQSFGDLKADDGDNPPDIIKTFGLGALRSLQEE
ncbi:UreD urease accessory protein-domain-containing protein [Peziza echinospora]|nr:UreD urease accessory protein-domain-containing protein [Peziza echinospora]